MSLSNYNRHPSTQQLQPVTPPALYISTSPTISSSSSSSHTTSNLTHLAENHPRQIETKCHLRQMEDTYSIIYLRKPKLSNNKNETEINILRPHSLLTLSTDPHLPYVSLISPHRESSRRMLKTKRI